MEQISKESFTQILSNAKNGSDEDLAIVIQMSNPLVQGIITTYCGYQQVDTDDIYSIVLQGLVESIESFDLDNPSFFHYAKRVIRYKLNDYIRFISRQKRAGFNEVAFLDECYYEGSNCSMDVQDIVLEKLDAQEKLELVLDIVDTKLSSSYKEVFYLYYIDDLSIGEVAETLNISYTAAAKRIRRMTKRIQQLVKK